MSRARLVLLSLVAVLSASAMLASSASAAIEFKWKVAGAELKAGESEGFTVNNDEKRFALRGELAGAPAVLLSTLVDVLPGAVIKGGVPGTNEETALFLGVTVDNPAHCLVLQSGANDQVQTTPLETEIVEGAKGEVGNNEVDILFRPKVGTTFATFKLDSIPGGTGCLVNGQVAAVTGTVLALALPQKTEVLRQNLVSEANTKEYRNHAGEFKTAGLVFAEKKATLEGLVLVILNSDKVFGPF
jgi:hypothetical protein